MDDRDDSRPNRHTSLPGPGPEYGQRVLLVDDDALLRRTIARGLTRAGMDVRATGSADEALLILAEFQPRVVLSDLMLPGSHEVKDGLELLRRAGELLPDVERILITAYADRAEQARALHGAGISRVLVKPFDTEMLRLAIRSALERADLVQRHRRLAEVSARQNEQLHALNKNLRAAIAERVGSVIAAKELYERALDSVDSPVAFVGVDGAIKVANQAFARAVDEDVRDVVGRVAWSLFDGGGAPGAGWPVEDGALTPQGPASFRLPFAGGRVVQVTLTPVAGEPPAYILGMCEATAEARELRRRLLEERVLAVRDISNGLVHELGNPLAGSLALIEIRLGEPDVTANERAVLVELLASSQRCGRVLQSLTSLTNELVAAQARGQDDIELAASIERAVAAARLATGGAQPLVFVEPRLPTLRGPRSLFERALSALLVNAVEATRRAQRLGLIEVRALRRGDDVLVEVSDEGSGVEDDQRRAVFTPFVSGKETVEGKGLGLPFVHDVATSMDGHVDVLSGPEGGATFRMIFSARSAP